MVRWEPGGRSRLQTAAVELFLAQGFEQTTAAQIAESAGLTERTFFRHFTDKREVLFEGQEHFQQVFVDGAAEPPRGEAPLVLVSAALALAAALFPQERREGSRLRQRVIAANPALQERELLKLAGVAAALAAALRERGVHEPSATLAAESGLTVFTVAFGQWLAEGEERPLEQVVGAVLAELTTLARPGGNA